MTILSVIGELIFIVIFCCLIFGVAVIVSIIEFVFRILRLLYKVVFGGEDDVDRNC